MGNHKKHIGYWSDFENVQREIQEFIHAHGTPGVMPTFDALLACGYSGLCNAIQRHGGFHLIAERLNLTSSHKVKGYWHDFGNVEHEINKFNAEQGIEGNGDYMPTARELSDAGKRSLVIAIYKHGGFSAVATKLGLTPRDPVIGDLHDFKRIQEEIAEFIAEHGTTGYMPTFFQLNSAGHTTLVAAIKKHGGFSAVAAKLGLRERDVEIAYATAPHRSDSAREVYEF